MTEFLTIEEIELIQHTELTRTISYLAEQSPFYRAIFQKYQIDPGTIQTVSDLRLLPTTSKEDLQQQADAFLCVDRKKIIDYSSTSGTLGEPVTIGLTANDLDRLAMNEYGSFTIADGHEGELYQLHLTLDRQFMAGIAYYAGLRKLGAGIIRLGPGLPAMQYENIRRYSPTAIVGVPSMLLRLIEYCREKNLSLAETSVQKMICIGENIRQQDFSLNTIGKLIHDAWPIHLYSTYASTEMQTAFTECRYGRGGHHQPELIIVEMLDEEGQPVRDGMPGEVTFTTLGVEGMPLLRYRTGDISIRHSAPCACGRNTFRLSPLLGRKKQMIKLRGTTLYPQAFQEILQGLDPVIEYVLEVSTGALELDEVILHLQLRDQEKETIGKIRTELQARLRIIPDIHLHEAESIHRMLYSGSSRKIQRFIDRRGTL